jgi:hypothetical protein
MEFKMNYEEIYNEAHIAGCIAVASLKVRPMIVSEHSNPLDNSSKVVRQYYVGDGVCGFAWVKITPARGKFVKWLKDNRIGRSNSYEGGYDISISDYNQSLQKKEAYANAFAKVLVDKGINAYANSRMD